MILTQIEEIQFYGVFDRGIASRERIVLKTNFQIDMGQFGLMVGYSKNGDLASPLNNLLYWFGDGVVLANEWIHVYTGGGNPYKGVTEHTQEPVYVLFWGLDKTIFDHQQIVPILFKCNEVSVSNNIVNQKNLM